MSNILLAKPVLGEGWIDLSVGEAHVVRQALLTYCPLRHLEIESSKIFEYQDPNGYKPLVDFLEDKYNAPVVITNGAKQALGASFYALKQLGYHSLGMRLPYWALIPPLVKAHGLEPVFNNTGKSFNYDGEVNYDSWLELAPNNPDGLTLSYSVLKIMEDLFVADHIPFIHDAAYYTHSYLPRSYELGPVGDVQLFSISKMFGLSGIRLGYAVCYDKDYYKYLCEYQEMMTVGVSTLSQKLLLDILETFKQYPILQENFEIAASQALYDAKLRLKKVNPDVLEVSENLETIPGMFAWVKLKNKEALAAAKINAIDGAAFGTPGFIRLNLAVGKEVIEEVVNRLND